MAHDEHSKSHGYVQDKDAYLKRLRDRGLGVAESL